MIVVLTWRLDDCPILLAMRAFIVSIRVFSPNWHHFLFFYLWISALEAAYHSGRKAADYCD